MPFLSKSKIMAGLQCPKRLYLEVHHPELLDYSDEAERAFSIGYEVGAAARNLHPGGKLIEHQGHHQNAINETRTAPVPPAVRSDRFHRSPIESLVAMRASTKARISDSVTSSSTKLPAAFLIRLSAFSTAPRMLLPSWVPIIS